MSLAVIPSRFPFQDPTAREREAGAAPVTPPLSNQASTAAGPKLTAVPFSMWIAIYGLFLMLLIVVYFGFISAVVITLLDLEGWLVKELWPVTNLWYIKINVVFLLLFPITRLSTHLWRGILGVITDRNDVVHEKAGGILLGRDEHPSLYAVVEEVSRHVMAPVPDEIRLTFRPDCYAVEQRSFGISTVRRLVLVIGLPQFEVLTLSELKVIIAHELAHFGGGDTRLGVFAFRFLEALRLAREENAESGWRWVDPVAWLSWIYLNLFLVLSAPIRKHQELRADGYSAAAYGGDFAAQTLLKDWQIEKQFQQTLQRFLHLLPRDSSEYDNIFREFNQKFHGLSPQGSGVLEDRLRTQERTAFWDSHPSVPERMQAMRKYVDRELPEPMPAYLLLRDVDALEKKLQEQLDATQPAFPKNYLG
jgi:Zn-dependent protease with chaperone function